MKVIIVHTLDGSEVLTLGPESQNYAMPDLELARLAFGSTQAAQGVATVTTITEDGESSATFDLITH